MNTSESHVFAVYRATVKDEWIDYNGHLSEAYYVLVFGFATDAAMDELGINAKYRNETGASLYTVEAHLRYLQEVSAGAELTVTTTIVDSGPKKLHLAHEMSVAGDVAATEEVMSLHVSGDPMRTVPFPPEITERIAVNTTPPTARHDWIGRSIGAGR